MALVTEKALFVHVPKTGGTWVRRAIAAAGIRAEESGPFDVHDHYGLLDLPSYLVADRFTFGYVRHPVSWVQSRWAWAVRSGFPSKVVSEPKAAGHWMADCWSDEFPTFVERYLERHPGVACATMLRMLGFGRAAAGAWEPTRFAARRVCRYESLADDLVVVLSEAGERFDREAIARLADTRCQRGTVIFGERCAMPPSLQREVARAEAALIDLFYG